MELTSLADLPKYKSTSLAQPMYTVVIVGGGAAGVLVAANLIRGSARSSAPMTVAVVDPAPRIGAGAAYSTAEARHLLNVPAGRMAAFPDLPTGFLDWLHRSGHPHVEATDFVSRGLFGSYLSHALDRLTAEPSCVSLAHVRDRAVALETGAHHPMVRLGSGAEVTASAVVLALGNIASRTDWAPDGLRSHPRFVDEPWAPGALRSVRDADEVLLVGTGLTMVDVALALDRPGRAITSISRSGRLPSAHCEQRHDPVPPPRRLRRCRDLSSIRQTIRVHLDECRHEQGDWRPALDGLRPVTPEIWSRLSEQDRREVLDSDVGWWNRHRHRMAPEVARDVANLQEAGRLQVRPGEVARASAVDDRIQVELTDGTVLQTDAVVNCTGQQTDLTRVADPLIDSIFAGGAGRPGCAGLGLDTDPTGRLVGRDGRITPGVFTLGATRIGQLWESTAIPEIAAQARTIALELATTPRIDHIARRRQDPAGLALSTTPPAAAAYSAALRRIMRVQGGAERDLQLALRLDPDFALGHVVLALLGHEWQLPVDTDAELELARRCAERSGTARERGFVMAATARIRGEGDGTTELIRHVQAHPRDVLAVSLLLPTIAFSGATLDLDDAWRLVDDLTPEYPGSWWHGGLLAFARQESDRFDEALPLALAALDAEPAAGHAVHARTHIHYQMGSHLEGLQWINGWIERWNSQALCPAHFAWHAGLHELALGDLPAAQSRYFDHLCTRHVRGVRALVDSASFLWRAHLSGDWASKLLGQKVVAAVEPALIRRPPNGFVAFHAAFALAAADDTVGLADLQEYADASPDADFREIIGPLAGGLHALVQGSIPEAAAALRGVDASLVRVGGSAVQRGVLAETLEHLPATGSTPLTGGAHRI